MRSAVTMSCFLINIILHTGELALIETEETVWAEVGGQASLSCRLTEGEDVLQITWLRVLPDGERNLATYTEKFGSRVRPDLQEKMDFQYESLQSCSMVIRKVTQQDAGCYRCLFNTYPRGALIGRTCISLYELDEPVLDVRRSDSAESVVSCSATGRPAPTVTLTVLQHNLTFSHLNSSRVTNTNGTVTVTTTALLSASSSTQVGCSVSVFSAAARELLLTVPGATETDGDGLDVESASNYTFIGCLVSAGFGVFCGVAVAAALIYVLLKKWIEKKEGKDALDTKSFDLADAIGVELQDPLENNPLEFKDAAAKPLELEGELDIKFQVEEPPVVPKHINSEATPQGQCRKRCLKRWSKS